MATIQATYTHSQNVCALSKRGWALLIFSPGKGSNTVFNELEVGTSNWPFLAPRATKPTGKGRVNVLAAWLIFITKAGSATWWCRGLVYSPGCLLVLPRAVVKVQETLRHPKPCRAIEDSAPAGMTQPRKEPYPAEALAEGSGNTEGQKKKDISSADI